MRRCITTVAVFPASFLMMRSSTYLPKASEQHAAGGINALFRRTANEVPNLRKRQLPQSAAIDMRDNVADEYLAAASCSAVSGKRLDQVTTGG